MDFFSQYKKFIDFFRSIPQFRRENRIFRTKKLIPFKSKLEFSPNIVLKLSLHMKRHRTTLSNIDFQVYWKSKMVKTLYVVLAQLAK